MSEAENSAPSARRVVGRPFPKGQTGNAGGRPKAEHDVVAIAREKGPDAIRTLAEIMLNTKASDNARVGAANSLLERGFGKPTQTIAGDLTLHRPLLELTDDQLLALVAPQLAIEHCNEE
jgi:hypothetical protein